MTFFLGTLDVVANTPTSFKVGQGGLSGIIIGNESPLTTIVSYDGTSYSKSLYPGTVDYFPVPHDSSSGNLIIKPSSLLSNASSWPSSFLQFDGVGIHERINTGTYPITLQRWLGGGNITAAVTQVQTLFNNGFPVGTSVISIGVLGTNGSVWTLNNDGTGVFFVESGGVFTQVLKFATSDPQITLGAGTPHIVEVMNNLKLDASLCGNNTPLTYKGDGTHTDWTRSGEIAGTNVTINGAKVVTHNLLVDNVATIPDIVLLTPSQASATYFVDTLTNTQFTIHTTSVWNFTWIAIKF